MGFGVLLGFQSERVAVEVVIWGIFPGIGGLGFGHCTRS